MARFEEQIVAAGGKNINKILLTKLSGRTLEGIKGQRRKQTYKDLVCTILAEMRTQPSLDNSSAKYVTPSPIPRRPDPETLQDSPKDPIIKFMEELPPSKTSALNEGILEGICRNLGTWPKARILEEITIYLLETFLIPQRKPKKRVRSPTCIPSQPRKLPPLSP